MSSNRKFSLVPPENGSFLTPCLKQLIQTAKISKIEKYLQFHNLLVNSRRSLSKTQRCQILTFLLSCDESFVTINNAFKYFNAVYDAMAESTNTGKINLASHVIDISKDDQLVGQTIYEVSQMFNIDDDYPDDHFDFLNYPNNPLWQLDKDETNIKNNVIDDSNDNPWVVVNNRK